MISLRKFATVALVAGAFAAVAGTVPAAAATPTDTRPGTVVQAGPPDPRDGCVHHTVYKPPWYYVLIKVYSPNGAIYIGIYNVYEMIGGNLHPRGQWEYPC